MKALKIDTEKLLWKLVFAVCVLFLLFFVFIHLNNRVNNSDEFHFLSGMKEMGFWNSLTEWDYNQRPVSYFLFNVTFVLNERIETLRWSLFIANMGLILLLIHSFKVVLSKLFSQINIEFEKQKVWALAVLFVICIFFFCFGRTEIWFWYICTIVYLLPFVFLNYGFVLLFEKSRFRWFSMVFFFLTGGTLELLIPMTGCFLLVFFLNRKISFLTLMANGFALLFFSFFQLLNKGIENRMEMEAVTSYTDTFASTFSHLFDKKNIFFILLLIVVISLFQEVKSALMRVDFPKILRQLSLLLVVYFLITRCVSYIVFSGSFGPLRMWAPFSLLLVIFIILFTMWMGLGIKKDLTAAGIFSIVAFVGLFAAFACRQVLLTTTYAKEYDLIVAKKSDRTGEIDPGILASPGDMKLLSENLTLYDDENDYK